VSLFSGDLVPDLNAPILFFVVVVGVSTPASETYDNGVFRAPPRPARVASSTTTDSGEDEEEAHGAKKDEPLYSQNFLRYQRISFATIHAAFRGAAVVMGQAGQTFFSLFVFLWNALIMILKSNGLNMAGGCGGCLVEKVQLSFLACHRLDFGDNLL
jgi:hypothetical protein